MFGYFIYRKDLFVNSRNFRQSQLVMAKSQLFIVAGSYEAFLFGYNVDIFDSTAEKLQFEESQEVTGISRVEPQLTEHDKADKTNGDIEMTDELSGEKEEKSEEEESDHEEEEEEGNSNLSDENDGNDDGEDEDGDIKASSSMKNLSLKALREQLNTIKSAANIIVKPLFAYRPHAQSIRCVNVQYPFVASGSVDETIRLYKVDKLIEIGQLMHHQGTVCSAVFTSDAKHLLSSSSDGKLCFWRKKVFFLSMTPSNYIYIDVSPRSILMGISGVILFHFKY